jgi:hypothetical protein
MRRERAPFLLALAVAVAGSVLTSSVLGAELLPASTCEARSTCNGTCLSQTLEALRGLERLLRTKSKVRRDRARARRLSCRARASAAGNAAMGRAARTCPLRANCGSGCLGRGAGLLASRRRPSPSSPAVDARNGRRCQLRPRAAGPRPARAPADGAMALAAACRLNGRRAPRRMRRRRSTSTGRRAPTP